MNKTMKLAVAAALAMGASAAQAGITIPAGDWTIDIGGNVNTYYTNTRFTGDLKSTTPGAPTSQTANQVSTGLLPSALGIGGKTRQNDLDIAFQFTFFVGANAQNAGSGGFASNGAQGNSLNIRQAFMTFGDKSWGTIKAGRDLGLFASDAILSDMTLLGVGTGAGGAGSSTLGRIGSGYEYADWVGQIQYASPNWNGFSFAGALREPWGNSNNHDLGFDGKVSYEWAGDFAGKVWVGGITQKTRSMQTTNTTTLVVTPSASNRSEAWEIGGKVGYAGAELVGYYYDGKNMGIPAVSAATELSGLTVGASTVDHDNSGGYVQATYKIPGVGTKLGASWGESKISANGAGVDFKNESWVVGAYHPLTKSLNLVAEYTEAKIKNQDFAANDGKAKTIALGAILFF